MEEFLEQLRLLKAWSGLSYRQLAERAEAAGDTLPSSTIASMLNRPRCKLPREELVESFTRACGCDEEMIAEWLAVRKRNAMAAAQAFADDTPHTQPDEPDSVRQPEPSRSRGRPLMVVLAPVGVILALLGTALLVHRFDNEPVTPQPPAMFDTSQVQRPLPPGEYRIRVAHTGLCLAPTARAETSVIHQTHCDRNSTRSLRWLGKNVYSIGGTDPKPGTECMAFDDTGRDIVETSCADKDYSQRFRIDPVPAQGDYFRLRSAEDDDECIGVMDRTRSHGIKAARLRCSETMAGQLFSFEQS